MNEFEAIRRFQSHDTQQGTGLFLGSGDDCALLCVPPHTSLAVSIDSLVEGTHFLKGTAPFSLGYKSVAVSLSDCAAMGAKPVWLTFALTTPSLCEAWIDELAKGAFSLLNPLQVKLIGGNLTKGPLSITTQIHGFVDPTLALKRSAAIVGDDLYVTHTLGDAAAGLALLLNQEKFPFSDNEKNDLIDRLRHPTPRVLLGEKLLGIAHAAIDLSDGLLGDLAHMLAQSQVGARLELNQLPLSKALQKLPRPRAWQYALCGGDDYELCFSAPRENREKIKALEKASKISITRIGEITKSGELLLNSPQGILRPSDFKNGFTHF